MLGGSSGGVTGKSKNFNVIFNIPRWLTSGFLTRHCEIVIKEILGMRERIDQNNDRIFM